MLIYWEFGEEPLLRETVDDLGFPAAGTLLQPAHIGTSLVEVRINQEGKGGESRSGRQADRGDSGGTNTAYDAVRAAISAAEGFRADVNDEEMRNAGDTKVILIPAAVTSGALLRGELNADGEI